MRLAKDGNRILCVDPDCGCEIAKTGDDGNEVDVPSGFHYDVQTGVWSLSDYARKRVRRGLTPLNRRGIVRGRSTRSESNTARARAGKIVAGKWVHTREPLELPARIRCPDCNVVQILDAEYLGLDRH